MIQIQRLKRLWYGIQLYWKGYCFKHETFTSGLCLLCRQEKRSRQFDKKNQKHQRRKDLVKLYKELSAHENSSDLPVHDHQA